MLQWTMRKWKMKHYLYLLQKKQMEMLKDYT